MTDTALLDTVAWDLCLNSACHIAVASNPYSATQRVSCACRLFSGEAWYDSSKGVPYLPNILGRPGAVSILKHELETTAESVTDVQTATATLVQDDKRNVIGQIAIVDVTGAATVASTGAVG